MSTVPTPPYDLLKPPPSSPAQIQLRKPIDADDPDGPEEPDFPRKPLYREDAIWGVGHRSMQEGMLDIRVVAWFELAVGDYVEVIMKDQKDPKAFGYVREEKSEYFLSVKKADLPEGEVPIFIRVFRSNGQEGRTHTILVLIKTTLPGGNDLRFWEDWHSELKLSLEDLPEDSIIDKDIVAAGVWCLIEKYPNCRKNDRFTIKWAGEEFYYTVSPEDVAHPGPIRVQVPAETIRKGIQDGKIGVGFTVQDVVGNQPGGNYTYSKPYKVRLQTNKDLYKPPALKVDAEPTTQVDFDTQHNSVFVLKTYVPSYNKPKPNPRHTITVVLSIKKDDDTWVEVRLKGVPDTNVEGEDINVPNDIIAKAAGGQERGEILAWVEVHNASGTKLGSSGYAQIFVVGTATKMPAPLVSPLEGTLMPLDTDAAATIPSYQPHNRSWREDLVIRLGKEGGSSVIYTDSRLAGEQGGVRDVLKEDLKQFENKGPFSIFYRVNNGKGLASSIRQSEVVTAEIGVRVIDAPAPIVKYNVNGNLDPKDVKRSVIQMSFPFIGATVGCRIFWNIVGVDPEASDSGSFLIDASTEGPLLTQLWIEVSPSVMRLNLDGSIRCSYSVQKEGTATTPKTYVRSELLNLTVGPLVELSLPRVVEADKVLQDQLHPKNVMNGATLEGTITNLRPTDDVIFRWEGEFGISVTEVTVNGDSKGKVKAVIPPEIIALAIRERGNYITVDYRFTRGQITYRSKPLEIKLLLVTALPAPTLNKIENGVFPLLALGNEAKIHVPKWIMIQKDQRMFLRVKGTLNDGSALDEVIYSAEKVTEEEVANGVNVLGPVEQLRNLKPDSILSLIFGVSFAQRDEAETQVPFAKCEYHVQAVPATLPAPAFDANTGPTLNVSGLGYKQGTNVLVAYSGMTTAQDITLEMMLSDGTFAFTALKGLSGGRVTFALTPRFIAQCVGKTLTLRYKVTTGTKVVWSDTQIVKVSPISAEYFPQALINKIADNGAVNLATFGGDPTLTLPIWILIFAGQRVWITLRSLGVAQLNVLANYVVTDTDVTKGLQNIPVSRAWLEALPANRTVVVEVGVALDGSDKEENKQPFKSTTYTASGQLKIDQSYMILNGVSIKEFPLGRTGADSVANTQYRQASGGAGGYTYASNNPRVASVDAGGKVTGNANGSATITVTDKNLTKVSYYVWVSNIYRFVFNNSRLTAREGSAWINTIYRGSYMFDAALYDIHRCYVGSWNYIDSRWTSTFVYNQAWTFFEARAGIYGRYAEERYPVMALQLID
ncbi:Ig-like domain-containing protein [Pseudomonas poae]|nr:Ig-like domain-containing protein [Pseudomonas poae]